MPRFYFHIKDHRTHIDHVGSEFPDLEAARDEAVRAAGEILRDGDTKALWTGKPWRMWVTQSPFAKEKPLFVLRFSATEEWWRLATATMASEQAIAIKIIVLAKAGERNPDLSCEGVVENFRERVQMLG